MNKFITITKDNNERSLIRTDNIYSVNESIGKGCIIVLENGTAIDCLDKFNDIIKSMSKTRRSIGFNQLALIQPDVENEYLDDDE